MLFTLFVAALVATLWALGSFLIHGGATHDPTTLELAAMAGITLATFAWMQRLRKVREQAATFHLSDQLQSTFAAAVFAEVMAAEETAADSSDAVPNRYASALAELQIEAAPPQSADHVA
jgi:hypothetical protein